MEYETKTTYYNVFVRNWWKMENGQRVPDPGARKTYIRKHVTYADARAICEEFQRTHKPGKLSRKAEFESV